MFGLGFAARGERWRASYSAITGAVVVIAFILAGAGFNQVEGLVDLAGLFQRIGSSPAGAG